MEWYHKNFPIHANFFASKHWRGLKPPRTRSTCLNAAPAQSCPSSAIPKSAPKLLRPGYGGRSPARCGERARLLENPPRILSRGCRHTGEWAKLSPFCDFSLHLPTSLSLTLSLSPLPFAAWESYYPRPLPRPFLTSLVSQKECSIMQKYARKFSPEALVSRKVFRN